jgi:predicted nucleic acid-binding protein
MTTAIDTNVIVALWDRDTRLNSAAQSALDAALGRGGLIIAANQVPAAFCLLPTL